MSAKRGLGKGLDALIGGKKPSQPKTTESAAKDSLVDDGERIHQVDPSNIETNPHQARKDFNPVALEELAESIRRSGILQPLVAYKKSPGKFVLIAGERRLRAAGLAGLKKVPVRLVDAPDDETLAVLGLIENLQREDLGALEEAEAFALLASQFDLKQEQIAQAVGKSRSYVANSTRLLDLPEAVLDLLRDGLITAGHGRAILRVPGKADRISLAKLVVEKKLSVRETERLAEKEAKKDELPAVTRSSAKHPYSWIADDLKSSLGTKVEFQGSKEKGRLVIHYFNEDDLTRIVEILKR